MTISISVTQPSGVDTKANWLSAPGGTLYLILREYSPGPAVLNGSWLPWKVEKVK